MKKIKIKFKNICIVSVMSLAMLIGFAGVVNAESTTTTGYIGPNGSLFGSFATFNNINGDGIEVVLAGVGSQKQVYARMGAEGSYSSWVGATKSEARKTDYGSWGSIGNGSYSWRFYWK